MDVHGNYGPSQNAAHLFDSPAGKLILQFQKWGANTRRMMTRELMMPFSRALQSGNATDIAYHGLRILSYATLD